MKTRFARLMRLTSVAALVLGGCLPGTAPAATSRPAVPAKVAALAGSSPPAVYGQLPLYFVENQGQADQRVAYYGSIGRANVYFTAQSVTYTMPGPGPASQPWSGQGDLADSDLHQPPPEAAEVTPQRWAVAMDLVGANPAARPLGVEPTEAIISYFRGPPETWKTGLPTYSAVAYSELWPGINLIYGQQDRQLKYSFLLGPGADPSRIRLEYRGATAVRLDEAGQLVVTTPFGELHESAPYVYQERDGQRIEVAAAYDLVVVEETGTAQVGFRLAAYDPTRPLVIDPTVQLAYAGFVGGSSNDSAKAIALGSDGSAYLAGVTLSSETSFPVAVGPDRNFNGDRDAFVAKVKPDGTGLTYAGYIGGTGFDLGNAIAVDAAGNAYVVGETASSESSFPVRGGPDLTFNGIDDAFVAKVDSSGRGLVYAGYIGGADEDLAAGVAVDAAGSAYVAGSTSSSQASFPVKEGPDLTYNGSQDAFVAKVAADGEKLDYAGYIGGSLADAASAIAVDAAGSAYVAGDTRSTEASFPVRIGPDKTYHGGSSDGFVAKVKPNGEGLEYAGYVGGNDQDEAHAIAVDAAGSAYLAGHTMSTEASFPVLIGPDRTYNGGFDDGFVAKVKPSGEGLVYAGYIGGTSSDEARGIAVDAAGNAYVAGETRSTEASFPVRIGPDLTYNDDGGEDAFVAKVDASGRGLIYAGYIGDKADDMGRAIAVDLASNAYVAGQTASKETGFPVREGPDLTFNGGTNIGDAFVAKVTFDPSTQTGTFVLTPTAATVRTGERFNLGLTWTVPAGRGWRTLKTLDLRLREGDAVALWVTWDEAANTFQLVDPKSGKLGPAGKPGDPNPLQAEAATLHLAETSVLGPPGAANVTLTLSLSFKPQAAGRTYEAEAAATDDLGTVDSFKAGGSVNVVRGG